MCPAVEERNPDSHVSRELSPLTLLTGGREEGTQGMCGGQKRGGTEIGPFLQFFFFSDFTFIFPAFSLYSHASSHCLASFHLLFLGLSIIIWLSLPLCHVWTLSITAAYSPSSHLFCALLFSSLNILPQSSDCLWFRKWEGNAGAHSPPEPCGFCWSQGSWPAAGLDCLVSNWLSM